MPPQPNKDYPNNCKCLIGLKEIYDIDLDYWFIGTVIINSKSLLYICMLCDYDSFINFGVT